MQNQFSTRETRYDAKARSQELGKPFHLCLGNVQRLDFPNHSFDAAIATFVFARSVPNPVLGLQEILRVFQAARC